MWTAREKAKVHTGSVFGDRLGLMNEVVWSIPLSAQQSYNAVVIAEHNCMRLFFHAGNLRTCNFLIKCQISIYCKHIIMFLSFMHQVERQLMNVA